MRSKINVTVLICMLLLTGGKAFAQLIATAGSNSTICAGSSVTLGGSPTASGGTGAYNYQWSPVIGLSSAGLPNPQATPTITTTYTVTVTDALAATATASVTVTVNPAAQIDSLVVTNDSCSGASNGKLCVYASGGGEPYNYQWTGGVSTQCLSQAGPGTYAVSVTNSFNCRATATATVTQPSPLAVNFIETDASCNGQASGALSVSVTGGTAPYEYNWWNGIQITLVTNLLAGDYAVTITDANGCTSIDTGIVNQPPSLLIDSIVVDNATCAGNNGAVIVYPSGGVPLYTYTWNPLVGNSPTITNLGAGVYSLTLTDSHGCFVTASATVNATGLLYTSGNIHNATCYGDSNGEIALTVYNGTPAYNFAWSNSATTDSLSNLHPGNYYVTVTDSHGCRDSALYIVTQPAPLTDSVGISGCQAYSIVTGGTPPYNYLWSDGETGALIVVFANNVYYETVSDANNCMVSDYLSTESNYPFHLQVLEPDSNAVPDSVVLIVHGGTPPFDVQWTNSGPLDTLTDSIGMHVYYSGQDSWLTVVDSNGCGAQYRVDIGCTDQCVWPGDANYDGVVNNNDLLPIGLAYDSVGYSRASATIAFTPQYCVNWPDTLLGGVNYKHVDCNGDGVINALDTQAIVLNYGLTHPRSGGTAQWRSNTPALYITISPDTLIDGETATATLSLGDSAIPCSNVYGLAFTYNFDPLVVDTQSVSIDFGNSWLAGSGDHINISKTFYGPGQVQAALTRIDHTTRSGQGQIGTISMKITTGNINGKNLQYYLMQNFISNLTVIDNIGNVLPFNEGADSAQVGFISAIKTTGNPIPDIHVFPNPATDRLNITSTINDLEEITIIDLAGQQVYHQNMQAMANTSIDVSRFSAGVYMVNLKASGQQYHLRFIKVSAN